MCGKPGCQKPLISERRTRPRDRPSGAGAIDETPWNPYCLGMNLPNKLTVLRIILSPFYVLAFFLPLWWEQSSMVSAILLLLLFLVIEISDVLDGYIARSRNLVTEIGKVMDPFADVFSRITYFVCFTFTGIMPLWIFIILLYRELGITFLRMFMIKQGIALAASVWGKLKAIFYALSGIAGLLLVVVERLSPDNAIITPLSTGTFVVFLIAAVASVGSFMHYAVGVAKSVKNGTGSGTE